MKEGISWILPFYVIILYIARTLGSIQTFPGKFLKGQYASGTYFSWTSRSRLHCFRECLRNPRCKNMNFDPSKGTCEFSEHLYPSLSSSPGANAIIVKINGYGSCMDIAPPPEPWGSNKVLEHNNGWRYSCNTGITNVNSGSDLAYCIGDSWSTFTLKCCSLNSIPVVNRATFSRSQDTVTYACTEVTSSASNPRSTCDYNGVWSTPSITCCNDYSSCVTSQTLLEQIGNLLGNLLGSNSSDEEKCESISEYTVTRGDPLYPNCADCVCCKTDLRCN